jgi:alpha,alpha-trehalose phosphorylase
VLERRLQWTSQADNTVRVRSRRLVSLDLRSVAAIAYEVEAVGQSLRIALQSNLIANQEHAMPKKQDPRAAAALVDVLESRLVAAHDLRVVLAHRTRRSGLQLAAGMDHVIEYDGTPHTRTQAEPDMGRVTIGVRLEPGQSLRVVKLLAYHWSSQQSVDWLRDQVDASLGIALGEGFDGLAAAQRRHLDAYWAVADVEIESDAEVQQGLRLALFELLQAAARAETRAIGAKGLTGNGYDGHAFWDTEMYVLPALTYTQPELVRDALQWRHSILPQARERAAQLGLRGGAMPWRTIRGEECSGYWPGGTAAMHVNAAVADAVRRYVFATGDEAFEREYGLELLAEAARLWVSFGYHDPDGRFRIDGVTGPDEYSALVDNNAYTNLMAQSNLRAAVAMAERHQDVARLLGVSASEVAAWLRAADAVYVRYDQRLGVHSQDHDFTTHDRWDFEATRPQDYPLLLHHPYLQLYCRQVVKQADLVMALFTRGDAFTAEEKRRNFDYYEQITVRDSSLSAPIQAIVAAEVGHLQLAYDYLAEAALTDLRDLQHNVQDGLHMASLGGALMAATCGFGGLRDYDDRLVFAPRLPDVLRSLRFPVVFRGRRLVVEVCPDAASYRLGDADEPLEIIHWGEEVALRPGRPERRAIPPTPKLDPPRQPPGREPERAKRRFRMAAW